MTIGMAAIHKHKEPSEEMKELWKKNGSLSDYQKKPKRNKQNKSVGDIVLNF